MINLANLFVSRYAYPSNLEMQIYRLAVYTILILSILFLFIFFQYFTRRGQSNNFFKNPTIKYYNFSFLGILLIGLNSFISSVYLVSNDGEYIIFGAQKAVLYNFGTLILIIGLVNLTKKIIYFNKIHLKILNVSFYIGILTALLGQTLVIIDILFPSKLNIPLNAILLTGGIFYLMILGGCILGLIQQKKYNASPLEKLRIRLISIAFIIQILQLVSRVATLAVSDNSFLYNFFSFFLYPSIDLIGLPISFIFLIWSLYTPFWLQIKANVIPKEFANII